MNRAPNAEQQAAIDCRARNILLLAGAGTGKTETMTERIARILRETRDPSGLLAVTFTRKAAEEMRRRLASKVDPRMARKVWMGTFHQVSLRILTDWGHRIGYSAPFTIYTQADRADICASIAAESGKRIAKGDLEQDLMRLACYGEDPGGDAALIINEYRRRMRQWNALDFDLMLTECLRLLAESAECKEYYQRRLRHVFVDEYQDTNRQNYRLHEELRGANTSLFCVGDVCQAIYGWRGSDVGIITGFRESHPDAEVLQLTTNYRSAPPIIAAANRVSALAGGLQLTAYRTGGEEPRLEACPDAQTEAETIARAIADSGAPPGDFAVLYRTHAIGQTIAEAAQTAGIPVRVVTPDGDFWDSPAVRACIARLRCWLNPGDDWSAEVAAKDDPAGLPLLAAAKQRANADGIPLTQALEDAGWLPLGATALNRETAPSYLALSDAMREMLPYLNARGLQSRMNDLAKLQGTEALWSCPRISEAADQAEAAEKTALAEWLGHIAARELTAADDGNPAVTLCTIHAAKGLEWPVVFVAGCEMGVLPSARALAEDHIEEERRLFYVAITRARDELVLTQAQTRRLWGGRQSQTAPSPFVAEAGVEMR